MAGVFTPIEKDYERLGDTGRVLVAGLGDSLTAGWMVRRGFFDLCVDALAPRRPELVISRFNAGVPGDTAPGGLWRVASVLAERPKIVSIQFGLNDAYSGVPLESYDAAIRRIVDAVCGAGAQPILVTSPPTDLPDGPEEMEPYYDALRELSEESAFPLADIDAAWRELPSSEASSLYLDDGVHPTDEGHAFMADVLLATIAALL
jgi:acyl-CoA thioesterase I